MSAGTSVGLSAAGRAFLEALRQDPRFADMIDDPFGDGGAAEA